MSDDHHFDVLVLAEFTNLQTFRIGYRRAGLKKRKIVYGINTACTVYVLGSSYMAKYT